MNDIGKEEKRPKTMQKAEDLAASYIDLLEKRFDGEVHHIRSGFKDLDDCFGGWMHEGHLIILAGRPAMGKTVLAQQFAENVALDKSVLFFTLEMASYELVERSISRESGITIQDLKTANIKDDEWKIVSDSIMKFGRLNLLIDDGTFDINGIVGKSRAVSHHLNKEIEKGEDIAPLGLIVVDYIQMIKGKGINRTIEVGQVSRALKILSKELRVPVIALSQLNRSLEQRPNKRPLMSDLRESGELEQDADMIFFIYRDEYYNEDSQDKGMAEIIGAKNRHGATGTVKTAFIAERVKFADLIAYESLGTGPKEGKNVY